MILFLSSKLGLRVVFIYYAIASTSMYFRQIVTAARKRSCGKALFAVVSEGGVHAQGRALGTRSVQGPYSFHGPVPLLYSSPTLVPHLYRSLFLGTCSNFFNLDLIVQSLPPRHEQSSGKVMFSQMSVRHSVHSVHRYITCIMR